ncbi:MAG: methylated-DNA--[protein]-cysteine S-methyltransferase [Faecalibacterium sp.]
MAISYLNTGFGTLKLTEQEGALTALTFLEEGSAPDLEPLPRTQSKSPLLCEAEQALNEYFAGLRQEFELALAPVGTPFQQAVWDALLDIPYGETRSYADIAAAIGKPKAVRAVGGACHNNPIAIIIPCHRVVGKNGNLTGYAGGLALKEYLLAQEALYR